MWEVKVRWSNPYTQPPEGKPEIKAIFFEETSCCHDWKNKEEISELAKENGYCIGLSKIRNEDPERKLSEKSKIGIRKKRCVSRIRSKYPLFIQYLEDAFKANGWELEQK